LNQHQFLEFVTIIDKYSTRSREQVVIIFCATKRQAFWQ